MPTWTFDIPAKQADEIVDALCASGGYQDSARDEDGRIVPNPQPKEEFAQEQVRIFIRGTLATRRAMDAEQKARRRAIADVEKIEIG